MILSLTKQTKPINILLVEDDDGDAKAVQRAFTKSRITNSITRAIDGVDALDILCGTNGKTKIEPPYILLVDINMPRMNGIELVKTLRENPKLQQNVIFILTTSKRDKDKVDAYKFNVAGYIAKEKAGEDFLNLINLLECYWRIIELPVE